MKLSHYAIIFVIIILPFSIICRSNMNEYFLTLKEQVRLNNVVDTATQDALETLIELNDEFQMIYINERFDVTQTLAEKSLETFFQTLAINFNLPYIKGETENYFSMYIPAILIVGYDGFFIYSVDDTGTSSYSYRLSPKIPYAYEDENTGAIINFTLGNYIRVYTNDKLYEGELTDDFKSSTETKYNEYLAAFGDNKSDTLKYLPDITNDMSLMLYALEDNGKSIPSFLKIPSSGVGMTKDATASDQSISTFHSKRREVITKLIKDTLREEINSHNTYASLMGLTYNFALPEIDGETWRNSINDISIMSFIQGMPIGVNSYYNNYALGASRIVETDYYYGTTEGSKHYYHKHGCSEITDSNSNVDNVFINRFYAAEAGYYPCALCRP